MKKCYVHCFRPETIRAARLYFSSDFHRCLDYIYYGKYRFVGYTSILDFMTGCFILRYKLVSKNILALYCTGAISENRHIQSTVMHLTG